MKGSGIAFGRALGDTTLSRKELLTVAACALAAAVVYTSLAAWHGALGASRSDDWVYYRSAYAFARDGAFSADPWADTMLVGHVALAQPVIWLFGPSITYLQLMVAILGSLALLGTYWITRSYLSRRQSALATGCLALGPIYGTLSVSFMTDIPAFALEVLVLLTGLRSMRRGRLSFPWFITSLCLGLVAFSIREYALAAPASVALIALRHVSAVSRTQMRRVMTLSLLGLLAAACTYLWRHSLPGSSHVSRPSQTFLISVAYGLSTIFTVSLFVFPTTFVLSPRTWGTAVRVRPRASLTAAAAVVIAWAWLLMSNGSIMMGNMFTAQGSYPDTLPGDPPVLLPEAVWIGLNILSLYSLLMLVAAALTANTEASGGTANSNSTSTSRAGLQMSQAFCLLMLGELLVVKFATPGVITDRYLFPLIPFVAAIALSHAARAGLFIRSSRAIGVASLALLALLGTAVVDASATFDGAKWQFATSLERTGVAPQSIDGGYEWFGYHQPGHIVDFALDAPARNWWNRLFDDQPPCIETRYAATLSERASEASAEPIVARYRTRTGLGVTYDLVAVRLNAHCLFKSR
ncbi:ArnT family glycosyltransferase [Terrabacter carboxydivorans]|uniref:Glycosyltransferase RgtA/B/C/D-like domain-containing protein n=1 Tax=Terrabacter carboxydivorans TaxID=619730 RepID=A0ABN3LXL3_9MICO